MVERLNGIQEVRGSNPLGSTILFLPKNCIITNKYKSIRSIQR